LRVLHTSNALLTQNTIFSLFLILTFENSSTNVIMSELYKQREIRKKKALNAFFKNSYKSAAVCAREFDVSSCLFQQRLRFEEKFKFTRAVITRLSDHQELALKKYIEFLDNIEISARLSIIRETINFILKSASTSDSNHSSRVERNSIDRFMKRSSQFFLKRINR
jgi:hypothetical protein